MKYASASTPAGAAVVCVEKDGGDGAEKVFRNLQIKIQFIILINSHYTVQLNVILLCWQEYKLVRDSEGECLRLHKVLRHF